MSGAAYPSARPLRLVTMPGAPTERKTDSEAWQSPWPPSSSSTMVASRCSDLLEVVNVVDGATRATRQRAVAALPQEHPAANAAPELGSDLRHLACRNVDDEEASGRRRR